MITRLSPCKQMPSIWFMPVTVKVSIKVPSSSYCLTALPVSDKTKICPVPGWKQMLEQSEPAGITASAIKGLVTVKPASMASSKSLSLSVGLSAKNIFLSEVAPSWHAIIWLVAKLKPIPYRASFVPSELAAICKRWRCVMLISVVPNISDSLIGTL